MRQVSMPPRNTGLHNVDLFGREIRQDFFPSIIFYYSEGFHVETLLKHSPHQGQKQDFRPINLLFWPCFFKIILHAISFLSSSYWNRSEGKILFWHLHLASTRKLTFRQETLVSKRELTCNKGHQPELNWGRPGFTRL